MTMGYDAPDQNGRFGPYGGAFVPEILIPELHAVQEAFERSWADPAFQHQYLSLLHTIRMAASDRMEVLSFPRS